MKSMTKTMMASVVAVGTLAAGCQTRILLHQSLSLSPQLPYKPITGNLLTPKALVVKKLHHYFMIQPSL